MSHPRPRRSKPNHRACPLRPDKKQIVSVCPLCANTGHGQLFDHLVSALLERHYLKLIKSVRLSVEALGFKGSFVAFALF